MNNFNHIFEYLIQPVELNTFFANYWEQNPIFIRCQDNSRFSNLISTQVINEMIAARYLRYPLLRLIHGSTHVPVFDYTRGDRNYRNRRFEDIVDVDKVYYEYSNGSSIVIQLLEHSLYPVISLCKGLEVFFSHPVSANAYLTPKNAQGLPIHFDTHEIFVLQIEGEKIWRIYGSPLPLPLATQDYRKYGKEHGECQLEITAKPGDVLYIPRGFAHDAIATETHSLHITVGIKVYTVYDAVNELLSSVLKEAQNDITFRQSLPTGFANNPKEALPIIASRVRSALDVLNNKSKPEQVLALMGSKISRHQRFLYADQLDSLNKLDKVNLYSLLQKRSDAIIWVEQNNNTVIINFLEKQIEFPSTVLPAIHFIVEKDSLQPIELPGFEKEEGKLDFCRQLILEGLLTIP